MENRRPGSLCPCDQAPSKWKQCKTNHDWMCYFAKKKKQWWQNHEHRSYHNSTVVGRRPPPVEEARPAAVFTQFWSVLLKALLWVSIVVGWCGKSTLKRSTNPPSQMQTSPRQRPHTCAWAAVRAGRGGTRPPWRDRRGPCPGRWACAGRRASAGRF